MFGRFATRETPEMTRDRARAAELEAALRDAGSPANQALKEAVAWLMLEALNPADPAEASLRAHLQRYLEGDAA